MEGELTADEVIKEAADVANFAMMIADNARRINAPEKEKTPNYCMECESDTHQSEHCHVCGNKHVIPGINEQEGDGNDA
jgi:hypothetical protein